MASRKKRSRTGSVTCSDDVVAVGITRGWHRLLATFGAAKRFHLTGPGSFAEHSAVWRIE